MKKLFVIPVIALFLVLTVAMVSASAVVVAGTIYNSDYSDIVEGASVNVTCNDSSLPYTSLSDGTYSVKFIGGSCNVGNDVTVSATKGDLHGEKTGVVWNGSNFDIPVDLSVVNVPLVPEFGLFIGALTIMSAVGVFFLVRKD